MLIVLFRIRLVEPAIDVAEVGRRLARIDVHTNYVDILGSRPPLLVQIHGLGVVGAPEHQTPFNVLDSCVNGSPRFDELRRVAAVRTRANVPVHLVREAQPHFDVLVGELADDVGDVGRDGRGNFVEGEAVGHDGGDEGGAGVLDFVEVAQELVPVEAGGRVDLREVRDRGGLVAGGPIDHGDVIAVLDVGIPSPVDAVAAAHAGVVRHVDDGTWLLVRVSFRYISLFGRSVITHPGPEQWICGSPCKCLLTEYTEQQ